MNSVLTLSSATAVARFLLPAHAADRVSDADVLDSPQDNGRYVCGLNISGGVCCRDGVRKNSIGNHGPDIILRHVGVPTRSGTRAAPPRDQRMSASA